MREQQQRPAMAPTAPPAIHSTFLEPAASWAQSGRRPASTAV